MASRSPSGKRVLILAALGELQQLNIKVPTYLYGVLYNGSSDKQLHTVRYLYSVGLHTRTLQHVVRV